MALVNDPFLILADEPTGNLDSERSGEIMELLTRLNEEHNQAIIMVTHDIGIGQQAHRIIKIWNKTPDISTAGRPSDRNSIGASDRVALVVWVSLKQSPIVVRSCNRVRLKN